MRLRTKLIGVVLFVALAPTAVVAGTTLSIHESAYDAQRRELQLSAARSGAALATTALEERRRGLSGLVQRSTDWARLSPEEREGATWLVYGQLDEIALVAVFDDSGRRLEPSAFIGPGPTEALWQARPRVARSELDGLLASAPLRAARADGWARGEVVRRADGVLLPLAFAVESASGSPWVVLVMISLEPICAQILERRSATSRVAVFDGRGQSLCADRAGEADGRIPFAQLGDRAEGALEVSTPSGALLGAVSRTSFGWSVVVDQRASDALYASQQIRLQSLLWLLLGVLGALAAAMILARGITAPLRQIEVAAQAIGDGELDRGVALDSSDELGDVARAFEVMRVEVQRWNDELLERVDERTRELRAAQDQLLQARKLGAMAALGAGISHEINNPLTSVLAFVQILRADADRADAPARQIELLGTLEAEAIRIRDVVRRMQQLAESGAPAAGEPMSLAEAVDAALGRLGPQLADGAIEVLRHFDVAPAAMVGRRDQIESLVESLAENAMLAMRGRDTRVLDVRLDSIDDELYVLEVSDTGAGIPADQLDRVMEPFFSSKQSWRGVGLGLSIAHRIVTDHGGAIEITSELGVGTKVRVTLPARRAKAHLS